MRVNSVRSKVALAIVVVLAASIALSILITVSNQRENLLEGKRIDLLNTNNVMVTGIRNVMLSGEAPVAVNLMSDLQLLAGFEKIEIYRRDGTIAFNDYATLERVNAFQNQVDFSRTERLELKRLEDPAFMRVLKSNTPVSNENLDEQFMEFYFPILNYRDCRTCHGDDEFIRGVSYFRISLADIFSRINDARMTLIVFYTATGLIIALLLIALMQRIVVSPVLHLGAVVTRVGEGDLDVRATLTNGDEMGLLSAKINTMIAGLRDRNRLEVENSVIAAREQENRKYLDNINEGLLLIRPDLTIRDQYSLYLTRLFGTEQIAGERFIDFIYPNDTRFEEERRELRDFISMIFRNTASDMEMIMSINPFDEVTLHYKREGGEKRIVVHADFQRIFDGDEVESVMVIFQDRTDIQRIKEELEGERRRSKSDLEHIAALLRIGPDTFTDYNREVREVIARAEGFIAGGEATGTHAALMRDLHSLKGSSRYMEFADIAEAVHKLEELLSDSAGPQQDALGEAGELIDSIRNEIDNIDRIHTKFKEFARVVPADERAAGDLAAFISHIERMAAEILEDLGKEAEFVVESELEALPLLNRLRDPIIHLVRNALDHGLEDSYQRAASGKTEISRCRLVLGMEGGNYLVEVYDNGRGIDFAAVRARAVRMGIAGENRSYSEKELLKILFSPRFSTRDEANELSGRGVGLDAVQEDIRALGGRISVSTVPGKGTRIRLFIPMEAKV